MNTKRIEECTNLSEEILKNIELSELPMKSIILKCSRLCRLMKDEDGCLLFQYESSGYPVKDGIMQDDSWRITKLAGRRFYEKNDKNENIERAFLNTIAEMEDENKALLERLRVAKDPDSYGGEITPMAINYAKNSNERNYITNTITVNAGRINKINGRIYDYILKLNNQLLYGNVIEDIFTNTRVVVDSKLTNICPEAIKKFVSVYDNFESNREEDWANAVHSCRRILKDVADSLYPPSDKPVEISGKIIKIGDDNYINRLIQFIQNSSESATYASVVGASLSSIGERLDSVNNAVCKGTHANITKFEAERYIVYTYLLLGDIISLI